MNEADIERITNDILTSYLINVRMPRYLKSMYVTAIHLIILNTITELSLSLNLVLICSKIIMIYLQETVEDYLYQEGLCENKVELYSDFAHNYLIKLYKLGKVKEEEFEYLSKELM